MKTSKEYPATHSMSTAWYMVDEEGNVGIMDYNENGPVPWGLPQTCAEDLVYGSGADSNNFVPFDLTDEQIMDLLQEPHSPLQEDLWFDCVVKIEKNKKDRFLELCTHPDISKGSPFCVSERLNLYMIDAYDCCSDADFKQTQIHGTLKLMIDEGLIVEVYKMQDYYMSDTYSESGEQIVHEKSFDKAPYYIYHQAYSTSFLPQKMHTPVHPVKIDQIPTDFRHFMHKVPVKFRETELLQIAQYVPCFSHDDYTYIVNGCCYIECDLSDGSVAYYLADICEFDRHVSCFYYFFDKCLTCNECCGLKTYPYCENPTILGVFDEESHHYYYGLYGDTWKVLTRDLQIKSLTVSFKHWNADCLVETLTNIIKDIKPRIILFSDKTFDNFSKLFEINANLLTLDNVDYPVYKVSGIMSEEIRKYACLGYRGVNHRIFITKEEMLVLESSGKAIKIVKDR